MKKMILLPSFHFDWCRSAFNMSQFNWWKSKIVFFAKKDTCVRMMIEFRTIEKFEMKKKTIESSYCIKGSLRQNLKL